MFEEVVSNNEI
jgi:hypothetical protein